MKIPLKATVTCKDGEYGSVEELLIDPVKEKVSHIVIINKHNQLKVIIPTNDIEYSSDSVINLDKTAKEIDKYPPFYINEFIQVPSSEMDFAYWGADPTMTHSYTMFPYVIREGKPMVEVKKEDIPEGEIKYKKGMAVKDSNGKKLGHVDELIVEKDGDFITHLVMRTGHFLGAKEIAVPNMDIECFDDKCVKLTIPESEVGDLPQVVIKRAWK